MGSLFITSSLLPIPHGFSTRKGGVSEGVFRALNTSISVGDEADRVSENLSRLAASVPLRTGRSFHTLSQVHGNEIVQVKDPNENFTQRQADALWTQEDEVAVGVKTADCVPVLIVDPKKKRVGAVHSGWRGTHLRVVEKLMQALVREDTHPADLLVAVGPSIRRCCYEVSEELANHFRMEFGGEVISSDRGRPHLDLIAAMVSSIERAGVQKKNIDVAPQCTACDPEHFFSHRRDHGQTGRHLNFVVCRF